MFGFLTGRPEFLDLAIVYGLLNVIGTIAVLKFFRHGNLGDPGDTARKPRLELDARRAELDQPDRRAALFCIIGGIGMLRMPDFYTRDCMPPA